MNPVSFAVIGCGRIGQRHADIISKIGSLLAVCDIDIQKASALSKRYNVKAYTDAGQLLEELKPDVAVICTPNYLHAAQAIQALNAGCHVLCEKPMAIRVSDCQAMIEASLINRKHLFIVKQNRFNPPVVALRKLLDENRLGRIFMVQLHCFWNRGPEYYLNSWKGKKQEDGGTLFTQFSHFVDLLYWLFGDIHECRAILSNSGHQGIIEFEDSGVVNLSFKNGVAGHISYSVNSFEKNMEGSLVVIGENGSIKIGGQYLNELEYQHIRDYQIEHLPPGNPPNQYGHYTGSMSNHELVYENVVDVIRYGKPIATSGLEGMKTVEIIERIYQAALFI